VKLGSYTNDDIKINLIALFFMENIVEGNMRKEKRVFCISYSATQMCER